MSNLLFIFIAAAAAAADDDVAKSYNQRSEIVTGKLLDRLYKVDRRVRPGVSGNPTEVKIDFYVQSFGPLNEIEMEFGVDIDFRQTWIDERLTFENESDSDAPLYIPADDVNKFWIPDTYFPNEKHGTTHIITIPNKSLRIYRNGTIRYFSRMEMKLSCTMELYTFPLDTQLCEIKISTYSYDTDEIILIWYDDTPIEIRIYDLNLPQFELRQPTSWTCNETYKTGNFSCLTAVFILDRNIGFFVLQTYVPSILIVMLSWVGFWINKNSEPARVALGITTVLTMTTQLTSSRSNQMRVSYLKAIDVWYSACMVFVFGAIIEFAFVNVSVRHEKKMSEKAKPDAEKQASTESTTDERTNSFGARILNRLKSLKSEISSKSIDQLSRKIFPTAFAIFNVVYWSTYIYLARAEFNP